MQPIVFNSPGKILANGTLGLSVKVSLFQRQIVV